MNLETLINECTNKNIKSLLIKLVNRGDNLQVYANDDENVSGQYVVGIGGYTVTRR